MLKIKVCLSIVLISMYAQKTSTSELDWLAYGDELNIATQTRDTTRTGSWFPLVDAIVEVCTQGIKVDETTLKTITQSAQTNIKTITNSVDKTNANLSDLKTSLDNSLLNEKKMRNVIKTGALTTLGFFICCCGTKMVYDSCEDIHEKITREENEYVSLQEILSWRDFVRPTVGLIVLGLGYTIIAQQ